MDTKRLTRMRPDSRVLDNLRQAAPSAFLPDGELRPFDEQVVSYEMGEIDPSELLVVSARAHTTGLPQIEDLPVTIDQSTLEKVKVQHGLRPSDVKHLRHWIASHPLAMDSMTMEGALVVVADATDGRGRHIVIPIHVSKEVGDVGHELVVDDVASVYGKRNLEYIIGNTASLGLTLWVNERTKGWTSRAGLQLPPLASSLLRSEYTTELITTQAALEAISKPAFFDDLMVAGWGHETMFPSPGTGPTEVTSEMMDALVIAWCRADELAGYPGTLDLGLCQGLYWCRNEGGVCAVDNSSGSCLVEGFKRPLDALDWLATTGLPGDEVRPLSELSQEEIEEVWADLGDTLVDDDGCLLSDWRDYPAGTDREEIWLDFDAAYEGGVHNLMFSAGSGSDDRPHGAEPKDSDVKETFAPEDLDGPVPEEAPSTNPSLPALSARSGHEHPEGGWRELPVDRLER